MLVFRTFAASPVLVATFEDLTFCSRSFSSLHHAFSILLFSSIMSRPRSSVVYLIASSVVVITIRRYYREHVVDLFAKMIILLKATSRSKTQTKREVMRFAWNKACIDETHQDQRTSNEVVLISKDIESHVWRWSLTETFFESSLDQMTRSVNILQLSWDHHLTSFVITFSSFLLSYHSTAPKYSHNPTSTRTWIWQVTNVFSHPRER